MRLGILFILDNSIFIIWQTKNVANKIPLKWKLYTYIDVVYLQRYTVRLIFKLGSFYIRSLIINRLFITNNKTSYLTKINYSTNTSVFESLNVSVTFEQLLQLLTLTLIGQPVYVWANFAVFAKWYRFICHPR